MSLLTGMIQTFLKDEEQKLAPELAQLQAAEAKIAPIIENIDPNAAGTAISALTGGKTTPEQDAAAVEGLQELVKLLPGIVQKLKS